MGPVIGITTDMDSERFALRHEYVSAVLKTGGIPFLIPPLTEAPETAGIIDGLILSGGDDILPEYYGEEVSVPLEMRFVPRERTEFEIAILREMVQQGKPVLAICCGMQLLNVAFGGSLYQDIGQQITGSRDHRKGCHAVTMTQSLFNLEKGAVFTVNSHHHQSVKALGTGLAPWAVSGDGVIEGVFLRDYPFLVGVQWHPERTATGGPGDAAETQNCDILCFMIFRELVRAAGEWGNGR
ncbi:MAG: gamma-glutamyl-gamma-aminobutyrate hydrolase family protein [Thermodesulfovibrionales bacterium]|jgi:putative glutamine amidotransferase